MQIGAAVSPYQHFGFCKCDMLDEPGAYHILFYEEDFDIAKAVGLDVFRTGIEWAIIEPREGYYDKEALKLFNEYLSSIKRRGIKTWVTLHHFTNPRWVWKYGGWESKDVTRRFLSYVDYVARELGGLIDVALIFNEPSMYTFLAYIRGDLPPYGFMSLKHMRRALSNINETILMARDILKNYGVVKSFTHSFTKFESKNAIFKPIIYFINRLNSKYLAMFKEMDYTSINFYVVGRYEDFSMRFLYRPKSLLEIKPPTPLAVTEFGIATRDEELRYRYLCSMAHVFKEVKPIVAIWWSFLHGYEWGLGYQPFFALVDIKGTRRILTRLAKVFRTTLENPPRCEFVERDAGLEWRWHL
ncbi:glycosyl hydrolase family 1 [Pyrobaculum islandicum DSM 4184]|uniref:Glycosyl hydrolase family 1 n=1 Tax=Pyrobaculum islandicum (strain DSM 4184 / JCM 9189 / GEO3) TaxID=384616 RepID=A1RV77_PYRIL|nr:family 1 glycosylhydrolase [Pyrobaculum islandicum]ABL88859.1 glycosyl hydrolase family 1 [Pyrobaculum islandicum DSM 4184]